MIKFILSILASLIAQLFWQHRKKALRLVNPALTRFMDSLEKKQPLIAFIHRVILLPLLLGLLALANILKSFVFMLDTQKIGAGIFILMFSLGMVVLAGFKMYGACPKVDIKIRLK